ncbi:charged multivesicular body protein 6 isoform X2 [Phyllopteryx taeniolatus]|uniref:charged multivesicular body protein 6 isoform X2 n=1 Tax=Phyllopteryx taeniolatus TaxID=161469 RepID=UPI002AD2634B|nr:charged multivesicular body protein 6 isoform X2 [Phyllopteryx taeniolatus]
MAEKRTAAFTGAYLGTFSASSSYCELRRIFSRGAPSSSARKALLLLKKRRYQDQLLDKTDNQISNLERMVQDLEFAQIEKKVIDGLRVGNECLKKMHEVMSIEEVERILDETQDAVEYQQQIDEMLSGSFSQEDEEAVLAELEAITQGDVQLPDVPSHRLPDAPEAAGDQAARDRPKKTAELLAA